MGIVRKNVREEGACHHSKFFLISTIATVIVCSSLSISPFFTKVAIASEEKSVIPANTTTIKLTTYKETDLAETSSMAKFMEPTAKMEKTSDGRIFIYATIKAADLWNVFQTEVKGKMKDVEFLAENSTANTKIVKFEVDSLKSIMKAYLEIQIGTQVLPQTTYTTFELTEKESAVIQKEIAFNIWNTTEKKRLSQVKDYIISPLIFLKENNKKYVQFTIKDASYWDYLKTELSGKLFDATIVSEDEDMNTRTYRFEINSEDKLIMLIIHMKQPGTYDTTHIKYLDITEPNKVVSTKKYNYSLITKDKKKVAVANSYMTKPLKVEKTLNNKYYATVTLKNANMWKSVKTEVNGKMVAMKIVSTNTSKNTKTMKFQMKSPTAIVKTTFKLNTASKRLKGTHTNFIKLGIEYSK